MQRSVSGHATSASSTSGDPSGSGVRSTLHLPRSRISANDEYDPPVTRRNPTATHRSWVGQAIALSSVSSESFAFEETSGATPSRPTAR